MLLAQKMAHVKAGPKPTSSCPFACCAAARRSRRSLQMQEQETGELKVRGANPTLDFRSSLTQH